MASVNTKSAGTVVYELNVTMDPSIYSEAIKFIRSYVDTSVSEGGFTEADILDVETDTADIMIVCIQFKSKSRAVVHKFVEEGAGNFTEEVEELFGEKISANRRIMQVQRRGSIDNTADKAIEI
eukprot:Clim_evm50s136 gene=Clim_evmTU50s136